MKKQLMATTALVAGGLIAGVAQAAEPIKLSLGGYITTGLSVRNQDAVATAATPATTRGAGDDRNYTTVPTVNAAGATVNVPTTTSLGVTDQFWEGEIFFVGETTLDNGIKIGVNVQLEAYTSADQVDEHYVYVQGGFGRLVVGAENSAAYLMHYSAPSPTGGQFGSDSPNFLPFRAPSQSAVGSVRTFSALTSDANKITYYTPRFAPGFQFGVSYAPDDDAFSGAQAGAGGCRGGCAFEAGNGISDNEQANHHHFIEAGANFVRSINGVDLAFDVNMGTGFVEKQTRSAGSDRLLKQRMTAGAGMNIGYAGWTFGVGALWDNNGLQGENNRYDVTAGVTYGAGPWLIGVNAGYAFHQDGEARQGTVLVDRTNDSLIYAEVGGQYTLGPGIRVFSTINFAKWEGNSTATEESAGVAWSTGFRLSF
jgi:outer membrane protein OmpU